MQEYVGQVSAKSRSVRYLIKLHNINCHVLTAILILIIILLFEEFQVRDMQSKYLTQQILYITINNHFYAVMVHIVPKSSQNNRRILRFQVQFCVSYSAVKSKCCTAFE